MLARARDPTAFHARQSPFLAAIEANWDDPAADAANVAWVREAHEALQPFSPGGTYLNLPGFLEEGDALLRASYGDNYARLRSVKAAYDPNGLFGPLFT